VLHGESAKEARQKKGVFVPGESGIDKEEGEGKKKKEKLRGKRIPFEKMSALRELHGQPLSGEYPRGKESKEEKRGGEKKKKKKPKKTKND